MRQGTCVPLLTGCLVFFPWFGLEQLERGRCWWESLGFHYMQLHVPWMPNDKQNEEAHSIRVGIGLARHLTRKYRCIAILT